MSKPLKSAGAGTPDVSTVDQVLESVRARGGRATSSRRALLDVLFHADGHLTADELAAAVEAQAGGVDISTIYRNLEDLQRLGVVVHSHLGHGPATYQLAASAHAHFICDNCGASFGAPDELFQGLASAAKAKFGFSIDPHHFAILGRCAPCSGEAAKDS
jgi:Fur family transcriptional regulator, ferric uptake regulator